jgi:hypothetical protein
LISKSLIVVASQVNINISDPDKIEGRYGFVFLIFRFARMARANLKTLLVEIADFYSRKPGRQSWGLHNRLIRLYNTL